MTEFIWMRKIRIVRDSNKRRSTVLTSILTLEIQLNLLLSPLLYSCTKYAFEKKRNQFKVYFFSSTVKATVN